MVEASIEIINKTINAINLGKEAGVNTEITPEQAKHLLIYITILEIEAGVRKESEVE